MEKLSKRNPELQLGLNKALPASWLQARDIGIVATDLPPNHFPKTYPSEREEMINPDVWPEA